MNRTITHDIWLTFTAYEQKFLKQIVAKKQKLELLNEQINEIHEDIQNVQSLLTAHFRQRYENEGFVADAEVIYKPKGTKHRIVSPGLYFDSDSNCMLANLEPPPNKKSLFSCVFADELKIYKKAKKSK